VPPTRGAEALASSTASGVENALAPDASVEETRRATPLARSEYTTTSSPPAEKAQSASQAGPLAGETATGAAKAAPGLGASAAITRSGVPSCQTAATRPSAAAHTAGRRWSGSPAGATSPCTSKSTPFAVVAWRMRQPPLDCSCHTTIAALGPPATSALRW
jgi:hypothetical protein